MKFVFKLVILLIISVTTLSESGFAFDHVTISLQNPASTVNTLEFDVYIVNDGTTVLSLGGYQFGVNFAPAILAGGTPASGSYIYIAGTRDVAFTLLTTPSVLYNNSQLKVVSTTVPSVSATPMPAGVQRRLGRFRFTNTVNWLASSQPNLQLQLLSAGGKTQCIAQCFLGSATVSTSLTSPLTTLNGTTNFSGFTLNIPLPVHITSFTGNKDGNHDNLVWATSQEENNDYFNLQHSTDGLHFTTIQKINSASEKGNSVTSLNYSAVNSKPVAGHNYYRLEQVDIDGHRSIETDIVDLERSGNEQGVFIFPIPVKDVLNIQYHANKSSETEIRLFDLNGRMLKSNASESVPGINNLTIDMKDLINGMYIIRLYTNSSIIFSDTIRKAE